MFNIAQYLEKFKKLGQGEVFLKEAISTAIKEVLNLEILTKDIVFKNGEIVLNVSPGLKNAVFIKKEAILAKIKEKSDKIILNIR